MQKLNAGNFLGSEVMTWEVDGVWMSLARYDESLLLQPQNQSNDWHSHQNPHLSFIIEGGNAERRKRTFNDCLPGQVLFYHSGELHQNVNVVYPSKNLNIEFDENFFSRYELSDSYISATPVTNPNLKFTMLRIYKEILNKNESTNLEIHSLLLSLFREGENLRNPKGTPAWIGRIIEILNDRWNENLSLLELANAVSIYPTTISRHFPRYFSCTLGEYVRRLRIEKALFLIKQSNYSLTEIAYQCGFADQSHFTRVFKEMTGLLPKSFRKI